MDFTFIPISIDDAASYHKISAHFHKDPFDKMLIWQAIQNNYTLLSVDKDVKNTKKLV